MSNPTTQTISLRPDLKLTLSEAGEGQPVLILHGGGGPFTVASIAVHLATTMHTIVPTHPGWNGTFRPDWLSKLNQLADLYLKYLADNDLRNVLVIGSSLGGWIGSEMAVNDTANRISRLILIDAGGIEIEGEPMRDFFALDARGIAEYSFHDAKRFYMDPANVPPAQAANQKANMATMRILAGDPYMHNPKLLGQLGKVEIPVLVLWGESDRIFTPGYGEKYAAAFQNARFEIIREAGHLPQIEQPEATFAFIDNFMNERE